MPGRPLGSPLASQWPLSAACARLAKMMGQPRRAQDFEQGGGGDEEKRPAPTLARVLSALCAQHKDGKCVPLLPKQIGKDNFVSRRSRSEGSCSTELAQSALMHELLCSIESPALS